MPRPMTSRVSHFMLGSCCAGSCFTAACRIPSASLLAITLPMPDTDIQILPPVAAEMTGERLDRYLASCLGDAALSRSRLKALILDSPRSEEHTSELQSLMRISYAGFCLKKKHTP